MTAVSGDKRTQEAHTCLPKAVVARRIPEYQHQSNNDGEAGDDATWKTDVIFADLIKIYYESRPRRMQDDRKSNIDMNSSFDEPQDQRPPSRFLARRMVERKRW